MIYKEASFLLKNFQMECMRENSWIEMALTAYETDGLSYEKMLWPGISELTHRSFKVLIVQAVWSMLGLVQHPLPGIWNVSFAQATGVDKDRQSKQRSFYIMKMVMRQMVYSNTAIISAFVFFSLCIHFTFCTTEL